MASITHLNPVTGAQGTLLSIFGSDIDTESQVRFAGIGREVVIAPSFVSAAEIRAYVPSFDGLGGTIEVTVVTGEEVLDAALAFALQPYPAVESVFPLCSLGALKVVLGLAPDETTDDAKLLAMIDGASMTITRESGVEFRPVVVEGELQDGDGTSILALNRQPIISVQGLWLDGQQTDIAEVKVYPNFIRLDDSDEYNPRLRGTARVFPRGRKNVRANYTSGYALVPYDVSQACILQVLFIQNVLAKQGIVSETNSVNNTSTTYSQVPIAPAARSTINRYRRPRIAVI